MYVYMYRDPRYDPMYVSMYDDVPMWGEFVVWGVGFDPPGSVSGHAHASCRAIAAVAILKVRV